MAGLFREQGKIGQRRSFGTFFEEFLPELRGKKGIETYREMADNDDIVGAILFALKMLIRQASWKVDPGGDTTADIQAAEFVDSCRNDMQDTWSSTMSEILSCRVYGWSYHEIVYKRRMGRSRDPKHRSKFDDGLIGWSKLPVRSQDTLWEWAYDEGDNLLGLWQAPPPLYEHIFIPREKALHFVTESNKGNPEGRSILRNAYRDWYFKKRIQEIEGIGLERDLAGFPVLTAPEGMDIWNTDDPDMAKALQAAEAIVTSIKRDSREGLVLAPGWTLELLSAGSRRQFDTGQIIERYDNRIAMTVLADFIFLGHENVGSFALSSDKTELFSVALGAYLDMICEVFNSQAIPRLIDLNENAFRGITDYPVLCHGDIETPNLTELGKFISDMVNASVLIPDDSLEDHVRGAASLPPRQENPESEPRAPKGKQPPQENAPSIDEDEDTQKAVQARKNLLSGAYKRR